MLPKFSYVRANSLEDAMTHLSTRGARLLAGGTDLLGCLRDDVFGAEKIVSIRRLDDLKGIKEAPDGGLIVGALTTISELEKNPVINARYRGLAQSAAEVASPQLRHQGTIGGNLCQKPRCWYYRGEFHCRRKGGNLCYAFGGENHFHAIFGSAKKCCIVHPSDTAPALIAFEAQARILGPKGYKMVPIEKLHVLPEENVEKETILEQDEIITDILLPAPIPGAKSSYKKVRARRSWDFALAGVALAIVFKGKKVEKARVVLSGAAPIPWRSKPVEEAIIGNVLDEPTIIKASEAVVKDAAPLRHNGYKIPLFKAIIMEELHAIAQA